MAQIPKEEAMTIAPAGEEATNGLRSDAVRGGAFDSQVEAITPFGFRKGEGFDKGADESEWVVTRERYKYDEQFEQLSPVDGKVAGKYKFFLYKAYPIF